MRKSVWIISIISVKKKREYNDVWHMYVYCWYTKSIHTTCNISICKKGTFGHIAGHWDSIHDHQCHFPFTNNGIDTFLVFLTRSIPAISKNTLKQHIAGH